MSAQQYGPSDTWPVHDKKHWHEPLAEARRTGWTLTYVNAPHRFGVVSCPAGEHTFMVDKTAKGAETKAKEALKKIRWCGHPPAGPAQEQRDIAAELLDVASQLVIEVALGLEQAEAKQNAQEALDGLELQLETAAANVEKVLTTEQEAALEAAIEVAIEVDDAPPLPVLTGKLAEAAVTVARGKSAAKEVRPRYPGVARPLLDRAAFLGRRIAELRTRLATLQERSKPSPG